MYFWQELKSKILEKIENEDVVFTYPPDSKLGDLSLACFVAAKKSGQNPNELAEIWAKKLEEDEEIKKYVKDIKVAGSYLNFVISEATLAESVLSEVKTRKDKYGYNDKEEKEKVMIEFSNGNTHKEYHIGHIRNISHGDAVSNMIEANGSTVIRVSYINDFGIHTAKTIWNWKHNPEYANRPEPKGYLLGKCYAESSKKILERPEYKAEVSRVMQEIESRSGSNYELWKETRSWSIEYFNTIYKELGVRFEKIFYESEMIKEGLQMVDSLVEKGILRESDGSIIADLEKYDLGVLPFIRSDKTALYPVADLSLAINKFSLYDLAESIYVVDVRQTLYFKQLFKILELLGYEQKLLHLSYEFVSLPEGMMSSRSGNVITYRELKEKVKTELAKETRIRRDSWSEEMVEKTAENLAIAVIKFEMLKVGADKEITFNFQEALKFDGYTACYLEYTHARLKSILRKEGPSYFAGKVDSELLSEIKEKDILLKLAKFSETVAFANEKKNPSEIAKYIFELAKLSNDYYHSVNVLKAEKKVKKARLSLIKSITQVLKNGFDLLGLPILDEM